MRGADRLGALDVNVKDAVTALRGNRLDRRVGGAIHAAVDACVLDETVLCDLGLHVGELDEVVVLAVNLARAGSAGRVGDGETKLVGELLKQLAVESRLSD
jgi:hypothetical protein